LQIDDIFLDFLFEIFEKMLNFMKKMDDFKPKYFFELSGILMIPINLPE
jgi:hypothetical protein